MIIARVNGCCRCVSYADLMQVFLMCYVGVPDALGVLRENGVVYSRGRSVSTV